MVSGDLDQLALDYILYFERRRQTNEPTVYLEGVGDKGGADVEDDSYLSLFTLKSVEVKSMTKVTKSLKIAFKLKKCQRSLVTMDSFASIGSTMSTGSIVTC